LHGCELQIGGNLSPVGSYLSIPEIVEIAVQHGVDAVVSH
jgi:pyruvate carboxylase